MKQRQVAPPLPAEVALPDLAVVLGQTPAFGMVAADARRPWCRG